MEKGMRGKGLKKWGEEGQGRHSRRKGEYHCNRAENQRVTKDKQGRGLVGTPYTESAKEEEK